MQNGVDFYDDELTKLHAKWRPCNDIKNWRRFPRWWTTFATVKTITSNAFLWFVIKCRITYCALKVKLGLITATRSLDARTNGVTNVGFNGFKYLSGHKALLPCVLLSSPNDNTWYNWIYLFSLIKSVHKNFTILWAIKFTGRRLRKEWLDVHTTQKCVDTCHTKWERGERAHIILPRKKNKIIFNFTQYYY